MRPPEWPVFPAGEAFDRLYQLAPSSAIEAARSNARALGEKELAAAGHASFVDQYAITRAGLEKMAADHADNVVPFPDGFHTGPSGGLFMAHAILTGLNAPAGFGEAASAQIHSYPGKRALIGDHTRQAS